MNYYIEPFGKLDNGEEVIKLSLENDNDMVVDIINYGGIIKSIFCPDKNGNIDDIVLGRDTLEEYLNNDGYLGAIIGRCANRIEDCTYTINEETYTVADNNNGCCLHGGPNGFHKKLFQAEVLKYDDKIDLILQAQSADMEENFPGNLDITVTYTLTNENELIMSYHAVSDQDTIINMTNHSYFNLAGHQSGSILQQELQLNAAFYLPGNEKVCPNGEVLRVENTPFDFRTAKKIGQDIHTDYLQLNQTKGYDHNYVIDGQGFRYAGSVYDTQSGRKMELFTDMPGVQIYTGNYVGDIHASKAGTHYKDYQGIALETQFFPNALKHTHFPSPVFKANQEFKSKTVYKFKTE